MTLLPLASKLHSRGIPFENYRSLFSAGKSAKGRKTIHGCPRYGNPSYSSRYGNGDNYLLRGEACTFIDPMFSSGVRLAMHSAVSGAEAVDTCPRAPQNSRAALRKFDRTMRHGPKTFSWFIYRITPSTMRDLFMNPNKRLRKKQAMLSMRPGDIFYETPIWRSLRMFKIVYRIASLINLRRSVAVLRSRRRNVRVESLEQPTASG